MTKEEINTILYKAHTCTTLECTTKDVDSLVPELKDQQKVLNARLENIMNVMAPLQYGSEQAEYKKENMWAIVKDMLCVFTSMDGKFAMGFAVKFGDGQQLHMMYCLQNHRRYSIDQLESHNIICVNDL